MGPHSPSGPNDVNVLMGEWSLKTVQSCLSAYTADSLSGIQSPATHQNGQPSPFYLHAMTSPVAAGVQIPSSAYALLSTFFSPQRTSAPTSADDAPDIVGTRGGSTSSRNLPTSALRQGSSAASNAVVVTAAAAAAAEFASKVGPISPTKDGHGTAPTTPSGNTRLTNRRFSSGTPLASPGRPQPPSRKSSKDLLFDYANVPKIKETADDKDQKENQMAGVVVVEAAAADSGADGLATVTRVTSTAVSADAQPL